MQTKNQTLIACTIGIIMLMELIDGSALNTSLPQMAQSFNISPINLKVAITIYLLTLGLFIPASSWVADRIGIKKLLIISVSGFIVSSVLCGLSQNLTMLIVFRACQGFFGAFTMPVARLALIRIFKGNLLYAMSITGAIITVGPMIGPLLGGAITTYLHWRFIFFINIPVGIFTLIAIIYLLPSLNERTQPDKKFDLKGFLLLGFAIALLMLFVDTLIDPSIPMSIKLISLIIAIILAIRYLYHAKAKKSHAIIDFGIFKNKLFRFFIAHSVTLRLSTVGIMFLFPLFLQTKEGFTPLESGLTFLAFIIPAWMIKRFIKRILNYFGFYKLYIIITFVLFLCFVSCAVIFMHFNFVFYLLIQVVLGLLFGSYTTLSNTAAYSQATDDEMGTASVIMSTVIQLSSAFAVAWVAVLLGFISGAKEISADLPIPNYAFSAVMIVSAAGMFVSFLASVRTSPSALKAIQLD